jgi:hypothetical protein
VSLAGFRVFGFVGACGVIFLVNGTLSHRQQYGQPEPGLRLVHHTRQDRQQLPRAAERVPVAQTGFRCASANSCAAKINRYRQQYADNQNISFLPAIMTTYSRMHGEFLRFLFLQAYRETRAHFNATGLPPQQNRSDNTFRFKRAAFYMGLKSKVGLVAAKASALRINLTIQGCSVVAHVSEEVRGRRATEFILSGKQNRDGKYIYPTHIYLTKFVSRRSRHCFKLACG